MPRSTAREPTPPRCSRSRACPLRSASPSARRPPGCSVSSWALRHSGCARTSSPSPPWASASSSSASCASRNGWAGVWGRPDPLSAVSGGVRGARGGRRAGHGRAQLAPAAKLDGRGVPRGGRRRGRGAHPRSRHRALQAVGLRARHRGGGIRGRNLCPRHGADRSRCFRFHPVRDHPRDGGGRRDRLHLGRARRRGAAHPHARALPFRERLQAADLRRVAAPGDALQSLGLAGLADLVRRLVSRSADA